MRRLSTSLCTIALLLALSACSRGQTPSADTPVAPQETVSDADRVTASPDTTVTRRTATSTDRSRLGDCDLLTADDIADAFGGKLTVVRISGGNAGRGSGCTISLAEGDHGEIILQIESRAAFELRRDSAQSQSGIEVVPVDIGVEGHLINGGQVVAVDAQDRAISIGLQLIVFGEALPITREQGAEGVQLLARRVLQRL